MAYESRSIDGQCPNLQLLCVAPVTDVLPTLRQRAISVKQPPHVAGRRIAAELPINVNDHSFQVNSVAERAPANVTSGIFDIQTSVVSFARLPTRTPPSARRSCFGPSAASGARLGAGSPTGFLRGLAPQKPANFSCLVRASAYLSHKAA